MAVVRLPAGQQISIRPIRPGDGPELQAAYDRLSPRSQYHRFLAPKPHLSRSETRYLVNVDGHNHAALVATPVDDDCAIVAVARYVRLPDDPQAAEFAIVVGDEWHGRGVASALMVRLAEMARAHGITRFRATMLAENGPAHRMVRRIPGRIVRERHAGIVDELEIELAAV
jgi:GNAT superfamily N-acetyltransferase